MPSVADCLRQHAPAYLKQFGDDIPVGHRKVVSSITRCRTGELGHVHYKCKRCGRTCRLRAFAGAIYDTCKTLLATHGVDGYKDRWVEHDFPTREFDRLHDLLRTKTGG